MNTELISEEVQNDNKQVNVRVSGDTYSRFMLRKDKMYEKGYTLSITVAINDGLENAIERADVWLTENVHMKDKNKARSKKNKIGKCKAIATDTAIVNAIATDSEL